jgi:hypothetical protein
MHKTVNPPQTVELGYLDSAEPACSSYSDAGYLVTAQQTDTAVSLLKDFSTSLNNGPMYCVMRSVSEQLLGS